MNTSVWTRRSTNIAKTIHSNFLVTLILINTIIAIKYLTINIIDILVLKLHQSTSG